MNVITQTGPTRRYGLIEYLVDRPRKPLGTATLNRIGPSTGRQASTKQRLTGIDIADPHHNPLIEQSGFNGRAFTLEPPAQLRSVEPGIQRVRPKMVK